MDDVQRLKLNEMIKANNVEDVTEDIRSKRHSHLIRDNVTKMLEMKKKYARLAKSNPKQFDNMLVSKCGFLFMNYTDIFNKVKKDEIDLSILWNFLAILGQIENGEIDQHEGAYQVGNLLKKIYIDSALKKANKLEKKNNKMENKNKVKKPNNVNKNLTWKEYKRLYLE
jgi:hypothetical protein